MSGDAETYDLAETRRSVDELYPVLLDAEGNVIDGNHRLDVHPDWRTETLPNIKTRVQLWAARIIANGCRRVVSRDERAEQFTMLAKSLVEDEGVPRTQAAKTISRLTTYSERYVQLLLPAEYKRSYEKSDPGSQLEGKQEAGESDLRSQLPGFSEALTSLGVTVPESSRPSSVETGPTGSMVGGRDLEEAEAAGTPEPQPSSGELPQLQDGAPVSPDEQITVPTAQRPEADATVAHDAEMQSGTPEPETPAQAEGGALGTPAEGEPREMALAHIRRFFDEHPEPDEEYLLWEVAIKHGVPTKEGRELIGLVKRERGIEEEPQLRGREAPDEVTCPLCSRGGACREEILGLVRDPFVGQLTLLEFVMGEMR